MRAPFFVQTMERNAMYDYILPNTSGNIVAMEPQLKRVQNHAVILGQVWHARGRYWSAGCEYAMKIVYRLFD